MRKADRECTGWARTENGDRVYWIRTSVYVSAYKRQELMDLLQKGIKVDNLELANNGTFQLKSGEAEIPDWTSIYMQERQRKEQVSRIRHEMLIRLGFTEGEVTRSIAQKVIQYKYNNCKVVELAMGNYETCYLVYNAFLENRHLLIIPSEVSTLDSQDKHRKKGSETFNSALSKLRGSLTVVGGSGLGNLAKMFSGYNYLSHIDLRGMDTSKVEIMYGLFESCMNLISVDVSGLDTSNANDMSGMFAGCERLAEIIGLSNFVTTSATSMGAMFSKCGSLVNLDLSSFHTSNVMNMRNMFRECSKLTAVNFGNAFNMARVADAVCMFAYCSSLVNLDLSMCYFSPKVNVLYMFTECKNLRFVNIIHFNPKGVSNINVYSMFEGCYPGIQIKAMPEVHGILSKMRS